MSPCCHLYGYLFTALTAELLNCTTELLLGDNDSGTLTRGSHITCVTHLSESAFLSPLLTFQALGINIRFGSLRILIKTTIKSHSTLYGIVL